MFVENTKPCLVANFFRNLVDGKIHSSVKLLLATTTAKGIISELNSVNCSGFSNDVVSLNDPNSEESDSTFNSSESHSSVISSSVGTLSESFSMGSSSSSESESSKLLISFVGVSWFLLDLLSQLSYLRVSVSLTSLVEKLATLLLALTTTTCFVHYFFIQSITCRPDSEYDRVLRNIELSCLANGTGKTHGNENLHFAHYQYIPGFYAVLLIVYLLKNMLIGYFFDQFTDWKNITPFAKEKNGDGLYNAVKCTLYHSKQKPGIIGLMMGKASFELLFLIGIFVFMGIPIMTYAGSLITDWQGLMKHFPVDIFCHILIPSLGNVNEVAVPCLLPANKWYSVVTVFTSFVIVISFLIAILTALSDILYLITSKTLFVTDLITVSNRVKDIDARHVEKFIDHLTIDGLFLIRMLRFELGLFAASQFIAVCFKEYVKMHPLIEDLLEPETSTIVTAIGNVDVEVGQVSEASNTVFTQTEPKTVKTLLKDTVTHLGHGVARFLSNKSKQPKDTKKIEANNPIEASVTEKKNVRDIGCQSNS